MSSGCARSAWWRRPTWAARALGAEASVFGPPTASLTPLSSLSSRPFAPLLWPEPLGEAAFHGIAGEIVRSIEPHTEADPAALLLTLLAALGNLIGPGPYAQVEATRHGLNLFVAIVGPS